MVFVCGFLCVFAKFVQKIMNLLQKSGKSHIKPSAKGDARLKWMLPWSFHIKLGSFEMVLCKLCKHFEESHEKSQEYNHALAPIVGKDLGQKFFLGFVLGVLEGLINRGSFWFSIFTLSSVQCNGYLLLEYRNMKIIIIIISIIKAFLSTDCLFYLFVFALYRPPLGPKLTFLMLLLLVPKLWARAGIL